MRDPQPADDTLHPPQSDDPHWTETHLFTFSVPERNLTCQIYPLLRPNLGICSVGVFVWDDTGEEEATARYAHTFWHLPLPEDLRALRLPNGLSYELLEPLRRWRIRYERDEIGFDVVWTGLTDPVIRPKEDGLDQPGRVTGTLRISSEVVAVDCYEIRDKSWHVRPDLVERISPRWATGSYTYGSNAGTSFLGRTLGTETEFRASFGGYLLRDGVVGRLVSGTRVADREPGRPPHRVRVEGTDELGRTFAATGRTVNRLRVRSTPTVTSWICGTVWEDLDGAPAWGQDQEYALGSWSRAREYWTEGLSGARNED